MIKDIMVKSQHFIDEAKIDIDKVSFTRIQLSKSTALKVPLEIAWKGTCDFMSISLNGSEVLTIVNSNTTPIKPHMDTIKLSQTGRLNQALEYRPLMLSGPCPTSVIWSGSGESGGLVDADCISALQYWLQFVFGVTVNMDSGLLVGDD